MSYPTEEEHRPKPKKKLRILIEYSLLKDKKLFKHELPIIIWDYVKSKYLTEYDIYEERAKSSDSFTDLCRRVHSEGFDAALGYISVTNERFKLVDFTQPFMVDVYSLYQHPMQTPWMRAMTLFFRTYMPIIIGLIAFALLLAYGVYLSVRKDKMELFFDTIAALFANYNYIRDLFKSKNAVTIVRVLIMLVLLVITAFITNFLYAYITTTLIRSDATKNLMAWDIRGMKVITARGYSSGSAMEMYGANVTYYKSNNADSTVDYFMAHPEKYDGIALWYNDTTRFPYLHKVKSKFGMDQDCIAVNRTNPELLTVINQGILELNDTTDKLTKACKKLPTVNPEYFPSINSDYCSL